MLEVKDLSVRYGQAVAVEGVDLSLAPGRILTVIGPNGAGKSSLLNALMNALPPTGFAEGSVRFGGHELRDASLEERAALGICLVPEKRELFAEMTVLDNLRLGAYRDRRLGRRVIATRMDGVFATFPRLQERRQQLAGTLSGGERQMLAIGRALMSEPKLLMLDEPSLGLAPLIVRDTFRIIRQLCGADVSILLVEQNARAALAIADQACVMEMGSVVFSGTAHEASADGKVIDAYLGRQTEAVSA